jgi:hypothetical protein
MISPLSFLYELCWFYLRWVWLNRFVHYNKERRGEKTLVLVCDVKHNAGILAPHYTPRDQSVAAAGLRHGVACVMHIGYPAELPCGGAFMSAGAYASVQDEAAVAKRREDGVLGSE